MFHKKMSLSLIYLRFLRYHQNYREILILCFITILELLLSISGKSLNGQLLNITFQN
jgi:hypothetical protein